MFEALTKFIDSQSKHEVESRWGKSNAKVPGNIIPVRTSSGTINTQKEKSQVNTPNENANNTLVNQSPRVSTSSPPKTPSRLSSSMSATDPRLDKFQAALQADVCNIPELKKLAWNGVPQQLRPRCWQIILGYLPSVQERQETVVNEKRQSYWDTANKFFYVDASDRSDYERETYHQIEIDVPRTNPTVPIFQNKSVQLILHRILYIWAIRHPACGYVQGINDLVTPFFGVFLHPHVNFKEWEELNDISDVSEQILAEIEADCYWCLTKFIESIQDCYTVSQPGIQRMLFKLKEVIQKIDPQLQNHIDSQKTDYFQFSFRWMNNLLMRELPLRLIIRLWDTYLSEGEVFSTLHVYVCASFLAHWSSEIRKREFQDMILFLQHLPTNNWTASNLETMISQAYVWQTLYNDSPSHLRS